MTSSNIMTGIIAAVVFLGIFTVVSAHDGGYGKSRWGERHQQCLEMKASILNLSVEELQEKKESGMSFADILAEQGMTQEEFWAAKTEAKTAQINQDVLDGTITQEEADQKLERLEMKMERKREGGWGMFRWKRGL